MGTLATTRMSSKGQVVIPESIRKQLNLKAGAEFVVVGEEDVVILKAIAMPDIDGLDTLVRKARQQAKSAGLKPADVADAVEKVRSRT